MAKCLYSCRDDLPENLGKTTAKHAKSPLQVNMRRSKMSFLKLPIVLYYHRTICNTEKLKTYLTTYPLFLFFTSELPSLDPRLPLNKTVTEGNSFTLHCLPLGNTNAVNVTWIRNNRSSTPFAVSVNLTVNATRFDAGEYNCVVTNGVESVISPTAHVDVLCK